MGRVFVNNWLSATTTSPEWALQVRRDPWVDPITLKLVTQTRLLMRLYARDEPRKTWAERQAEHAAMQALMRGTDFPITITRRLGDP
jgi:hypothetical protein